jgi:hypothetical protein
METYIVLGFSVLIYLMIGRGVALALCTPLFALNADQRKQRNENSYLLAILLWPMELGSTLGLASLYMQERRNSIQWFKTTEEHTYATSYSVSEIQKSIKNIEKAIQKEQGG